MNYMFVFASSELDSSRGGGGYKGRRKEREVGSAHLRAFSVSLVCD